MIDDQHFFAYREGEKAPSIPEDIFEFGLCDI